MHCFQIKHFRTFSTFLPFRDAFSPCAPSRNHLFFALQQTESLLTYSLVAFLGRFLPKLEPPLRWGLFF